MRDAPWSLHSLQTNSLVAACSNIQVLKQSLAHQRRHVTQRCGHPSSTIFFSHTLQYGSVLFLHCWAENSFFKQMRRRQGPWQAVFGMCLASTASQSIISPLNFFSSSSGPSGSPTMKGARSKLRYTSKSARVRTLVNAT